jgi:hypothetical protein
MKGCGGVALRWRDLRQASGAVFANAGEGQPIRYEEWRRMDRHSNDPFSSARFRGPPRKRTFTKTNRSIGESTYQSLSQSLARNGITKEAMIPESSIPEIVGFPAPPHRIAVQKIKRAQWQRQAALVVKLGINWIVSLGFTWMSTSDCQFQELQVRCARGSR